MSVVRRFLVVPALARLIRKERGGSKISEGYFSPQGGRTSLVRIDGQQCHLVLINHGAAGASSEERTEVPRAHGDALLDVCGGKATYERTTVALSPGRDAMIDRYTTPTGLDLISVAFEDENASKSFLQPSWFGPEVTDDAAYERHSIAIKGVPEAERSGLTNAMLDAVLDLLEPRFGMGRFGSTASPQRPADPAPPPAAAPAPAKVASPPVAAPIAAAVAKPAAPPEKANEQAAAVKVDAPEPPKAPAPEAKVPTPEAKAPAPEAKAATPEVKPPAPEVKPPAPEVKPPVLDAKAPAPEAKAQTPESKAPAPEAKAPTHEAKAPAPETKAEASAENASSNATPKGDARIDDVIESLSQALGAAVQQPQQPAGNSDDLAASFERWTVRPRRTQQ